MRSSPVSLAVWALPFFLAACGGDTNSSGGSSRSSVEVESSSGIPMILVPAGTFTMGNDDGGEDEKPEHPVSIGAFVMDRFEVTHDLMEKVQEPNPSKWQDNPRKPVNQVRWRDAKRYCNERSRVENLTLCYNESEAGWPCDFSATGYRLPTEAEWEYAAKAGSNKLYDFGNVSKLGQHAVFADNSGAKTHPVGTKRPNAWGFFDLYGNVSEWCQDVYDPNYYASSPGDNPRGPEPKDATAKRSVRGGSWKATASMCRSTFRQGQTTGDTDACFSTDFCGFRCVRRPLPEELSELAP